MKNLNLNNNVISNDKIIDNLVVKLCDKVIINDDDSSLKKISNTKIFKQLINIIKQSKIFYQQF